ncbi:unnamed protein product [Clavelina lepadiformis]|uniref:Protein MIX23 n=1 Tax=Clavelina lepadiformis TaxID=159417 RepID=A0ABP0EZS3_CLALP
MTDSLEDESLCLDFSQFMQRLKTNRLIDDRIIHELNTTLPTQSFAHGVNVTQKCKTLHDLIKGAHTSRNEAIERCISLQVNKTKMLAEEKEKNPENFKIRKQLGKEQTNLRLFRQELTIEAIVQERAETAFYERCREYYKPEQS